MNGEGENVGSGGGGGNTGKGGSDGPNRHASGDGVVSTQWVENSGLREVSSLLYHCSHLCASHILSFIHHSISLFVSLSVCSSVFLPSLLPPLCTRWHHRRR
jgi:hypothetical protein